VSDRAGHERDSHLPGLSGLRGVACLLVFLYHLRWAAGDPPLLIGGFDVLPAMKNCDIGVAIFFALSGLLLSMPFWRAIREGTPAPGFARYLWRRACRIVPAYYACLVVVYLLEGGTYTLYGFLDFLLHAGFLHTFSDQSYLSRYGVLWTIGIEFQFYLLLPLIMAGVAAVSRRTGTVVACLAPIAVCFACDWLARSALLGIEPLVPDRFLGVNGPVLGMGTVFHYLKYFAFGIAGSALTLHWREHRATAVSQLAAFAALVGTVVLIFISGEGEWRATAPTGWPLNLALFALLAAALPAAPAVARFFELRPLVFAGEISYGIYLWHELVLKSVFAGTLPGRLHGWALMFTGGGVALAVTVLIAWLSFRFLEQPAMRASKR
jgi:peptidoglycan/LPS O-acetylase OafA/YrhL